MPSYQNVSSDGTTVTLGLAGNDVIQYTTAGIQSGYGDNSIAPEKLTQPLTLGTAQATTSGTSIDFTGIPSWVKRITVMIAGVSQSGTDAFLVQLGDSGGIENTGYLSATGYSVGANTTSTYSSGAGFPIFNTGTGLAWHGSITLTLLNAATNTWVASGVTNRSDVSLICDTSGSKSLSGVLDRVRLTTVSGTGTFTAGSVNIMYE